MSTRFVILANEKIEDLYKQTAKVLTDFPEPGCVVLYGGFTYGKIEVGDPEVKGSSKMGWVQTLTIHNIK